MSKDVIKKLAKDKELLAIKKYTDEALKNPDLHALEKIKLIELNQENRLSIIRRVQAHTLEYLFKKNPDKFFTKEYHYDWWTFPMHVPAEWKWEKRNYDSSIDSNEAQILLGDSNFVHTYLSGVALYLDALKTHGWNDYPVRYARLLHSLSLFINAAHKMEGKPSVTERLCHEAQRAIDFIKPNILARYPDYTLLNIGFKATSEALDKAKSKEAESSFNKGVN